MKQGWNNHQTTILGLLGLTSPHGAPRAGFPPLLTLPCYGTYLQPTGRLQGGNGVDVHDGDLNGVYPAHSAVVSAPGFLVESGMDTPLQGFLHAEPGGASARGGPPCTESRRILGFRGGIVNEVTK